MFLSDPAAKNSRTPRSTIIVFVYALGPIPTDFAKASRYARASKSDHSVHTHLAQFRFAACYQSNGSLFRLSGKAESAKLLTTNPSRWPVLFETALQGLRKQSDFLRNNDLCVGLAPYAGRCRSGQT